MKLVMAIVLALVASPQTKPTGSTKVPAALDFTMNSIDGKPVNGADDVVRFVSFSLKPRDVAVLTILKPSGQRKRVAVTLAERRLPAG